MLVVWGGSKKGFTSGLKVLRTFGDVFIFSPYILKGFLGLIFLDS